MSEQLACQIAWGPECLISRYQQAKHFYNKHQTEFPSWTPRTRYLQALSAEEQLLALVRGVNVGRCIHTECTRWKGLHTAVHVFQLASCIRKTPSLYAVSTPWHFILFDIHSSIFHLCLSLPYGLFVPGFLRKNFYALSFLLCMCAGCLTHIHLFDDPNNIYGESEFEVPHYVIFFDFLLICSPCYSLDVRDQVSHP